jgi:hypothetical protein
MDVSTTPAVRARAIGFARGRRRSSSASTLRTRRAVMTSDAPEPLWTWLNTNSGQEDLQAWKRFLPSVPPEDGRRGLAAARLERLRLLFGAPSEAAPAQAGAFR